MQIFIIKEDFWRKMFIGTIQIFMHFSYTEILRAAYFG